MSRYMEPVSNISDAWLSVLTAMNAEPGGTATNVMVTVEGSTAPDRGGVRDALNETLRTRGQHEVGTVASTLFPAVFYGDPGFDWSPDLPQHAVDELDSAAASLYREYLEILPDLRRIPANRAGTYFSRMISWPGKTGAGVNQLEERIRYFRSARRNGQLTNNASDIVIAGDAELPPLEDFAAGIQEYAATDRRQRGFPCLVHIDLSAHDGVLALTAVYRHWHLITRAYGNMVGLARLQAFLAQQSGLRVGELVVVAGYANAERESYGGRAGVDALLSAAGPVDDESVAASEGVA